MLALTALAVVASVAAEAEPGVGRGVEFASAQVQATILEPVRVRQASGYEKRPDGPIPQITRRAQEILVEFQ